MKKIISFIIAAVFAVGSAFAANDLLDFEGVAGMNIANVDASGFNSRIGFHVGVRGTYAFQSKDGKDVDRFDVGLGLRFGFEFAKKCNVSFGYDFGLVDVVDEQSAKTRNASISVGYKF